MNYQTDQRYKALLCGHYHNKGDVKTRKRWNDIYMIDVDRNSDFIKATPLEVLAPADPE